MPTLWIVLLVCFSILDTAILVPWAISRRARKREERKRQAMPSASGEAEDLPNPTSQEETPQ